MIVVDTIEDELLDCKIDVKSKRAEKVKGHNIINCEWLLEEVSKCIVVAD